MHRKDKNADTDKHYQRREKDGLTVLWQDGFTGTAFVEQSFHNKNGVVVSLSEDKRGEDDIDDIELQTETLHQRQYPDPTESHRHKRDEHQPYIAETEP